MKAEFRLQAEGKSAPHAQYTTVQPSERMKSKYLRQQGWNWGPLREINQTKESSRSQILYRSAMAKENIRTFAQTLREEIANYKPPLTKLSMELNPRNLGTLELTITKKGKDLHVQVVSNATAMGLFLQNQVDFRNNLTQVGFNNVDLSFSTNENGSGNGGRENGQNTSQDNANTEKGNKNSLEDSQNGEVNVMHITLPKYA